MTIGTWPELAARLPGGPWLLAAAAVGMGVAGLGGRRGPWGAMAALEWALATGHPWWWLWAVWLAYGFGRHRHYRGLSRRKERWEAEVEGFLLRVQQLAAAGASAATAIEGALGRERGTVVPVAGLAREPDLVAALGELDRRWPIPAWLGTSQALRVVDRHGGDVAAVAERALEGLRRRRRQRLARQAETMGARATLLALTAAPVLVLLTFRGLLPGFWAALTAGWPGHLALTWVIAATAWVWAQWARLLVE